MTTAHPLAWPEGWPRTPYHQRKQQHPFGSKVYGLTFDRARNQLVDEVRRLGGRSVVLSTNVPLRQDGMPYAGAALKRMDEPGVAIYFMLKEKRMVMAQDIYTDIAANLRSLALAIDGMRQLERHGGGKMMERAFAGFVAMPPPGEPWWKVLGFKEKPDNLLAANMQYRQLTKAYHPDVAGGSEEKFNEITAAIEQARQELTGG